MTFDAENEWAARRLIQEIANTAHELGEIVDKGSIFAMGLEDDRLDTAVDEAINRGWVEPLNDEGLRLTSRGRNAAAFPPPLFPTPARKAARKLRGPTSAAFDATAWQTLMESGGITFEDARLNITALWIHLQMRALRTRLDAIDHTALGGRHSTILAVATLNRDFSNALRKDAGSFRRAALGSEMLDFDEAGARPLKGRDGQEITLDDFVDAAGDAVGSWLYDAADAAPDGSDSDTDLEATAARGTLFCSIQHGLHDLWQRALWEDWFLDVRKKRQFWSPNDRRLALLFDAWQVRNKSNAFQYPQIAIRAWKMATARRRRELNLPSTVTAVEMARNGYMRISVGRPAIPKEAPPYLLMRECLEGSYLSAFLALPLPKQPDLTCDVLIKAWCTLLDLADCMVDAVPPKARFSDYKATARWALKLRRSDVASALARALDCNETKAANIQSFLTWSSRTGKGLWGAPIVPVPGTEHVCLARAILASSNPIRCAEIWMQNGGLDDNLRRGARGDLYEAELRRKLRQRIADNELLEDACCAERAIAKSKDFPEQVDLLFQLGSLLVVGEVKCLLFPADPHERSNYLEKLAAAAAQAMRKAEMIDSRRDVAAQALGIPQDKAAGLRVLPLVVVNQGFGVSLNIEGCRITDGRFLDLYLGSGTYTPHMLVGRDRVSHVFGSATLYRNQDEAAARFESTFRTPPTLQRYVDRLTWHEFHFPTASGDPLFIETTRLGPMDETERKLTELAASAAGL